MNQIEDTRPLKGAVEIENGESEREAEERLRQPPRECLMSIEGVPSVEQTQAKLVECRAEHDRGMM